MVPITSAATKTLETSSSSASTVGVYRVEGSGFAGLVPVGCSFPGQPFRFVASGGSTYVFQVMASGGVAGFDLVEPPPPPYDDVANAVPVSPTPFVLEPLDASLATSSADDPTVSTVASRSG